MIVMTDEQKALFDDLTPLQQKVSLNVIAGMSNIDAYIKGGGKGESKKSQEAAASRMLSDVKVATFIDAMNAVAVNDAVMSRQEMLEGLSIIADMSGVTKKQTTAEALCESKDGYGVKLKAMKQLAELTGYDAAIKTDNSHIIKASEDDW